MAFRVIGAGGDGGTIPSGGFAAVKEEIKKVLVGWKEFWPLLISGTLDLS